MGRWRAPLLLAGLVLCGLLGVAAGAHSLRYNLTVRSQGASLHWHFLVEGRLDNELFLYYDSKKGRAELLGPCKPRALGAETCHTDTQHLAERGKRLRGTLAEAKAWQGQKGGSHSFQEIWGCETQEDNSPKGFWDIYYDGVPILSYDPVSHNWKVHPSWAETLARKIKEQLKEDDIQSKASWAYIQGELCGTLRRYLHFRMDIMRGSVPPSVNVTCSEALNGTVTLTCAAFGFYPGNLSLAWLVDGERLSLDAQQSEDVLAYGNGTYQTSVTTRIPQGEEGKFSCHVGHCGNHSTYPVPCGKGLAPRRLRTGIAVAVAVLIIIAVLLWRNRKPSSSAGGSGLQQSLNQQLMAPSDPEGTEEQLLPPPLLSARSPGV